MSPASLLLTSFFLDAFQNSCSVSPVFGDPWAFLPERMLLSICSQQESASDVGAVSVAPPGNRPWTQSFPILTVEWDILEKLSGARVGWHCAHRFLPLLETAVSLAFLLPISMLRG